MNTSPPRRLKEQSISFGSEPPQRSLAILPFRNLSKDPAASFYEFSLADAVITELARLRSLVVRPSSSIAKYQGLQKDPCEIGQELGVNSILAASYLGASQRLRVTAQLLDVGSGSILWSDSIDAAAADIITVQDIIARHIVAGLRLELSSDERVALEQRATRNAAAYEYLRGRDRSPNTLITHHGRKISKRRSRASSGPSNSIQLSALAYSGLGVCYSTRVFDKFVNLRITNARKGFDKALALDSLLVEARLHMLLIHRARRKQKARTEIQACSPKRQTKRQCIAWQQLSTGSTVNIKRRWPVSLLLQV